MAYQAIRIGLLVLIAAVSGAGLAVERGVVDPVTVACQAAPNAAGKLKRVPADAPWKQETFIAEADTAGYTAFVGWINAMTALPCASEKIGATVEIRSIRLIERAADGAESVVQTVDFGGDELASAKAFEGALFDRTPKEGKGADGFHIDRIENGSFVIDLNQASRRMYHGWTNRRTEAKPGAKYSVEADVRITGAARLQFGIDYWRDQTADYAGYDKTCQKSNNCEVWISDWYGDTKGKFVTIRAPKAYR
jgi:hypothetical protein